MLYGCWMVTDSSPKSGEGNLPAPKRTHNKNCVQMCSTVQNVFDKPNDQRELVHFGMARKRGCEETNILLLKFDKLFFFQKKWHSGLHN